MSEPTLTFDTEKLVKKAKRRIFWRNLIITVVVCLLLVGGGSIGNGLLMNEQGWTAYLQQQMYNQIAEPDTYMIRPQFQYGFLSGTVTYTKYKWFAHTLVPDGSETLSYGVKGNAQPLSGDLSVVQVGNDYYDPTTGAREMRFFYPELKYDHYTNDLPILDKLTDQKVAEVALSFDGDYTQAEVDKMIPAPLQASWYWVDNLTSDLVDVSKGSTPEIEESVYGFHASYDPSSTEKMLQTTFEQTVQLTAVSKNPIYSYDAKRLLDALHEHHNKYIIGAVVSGTKQQLQALKKMPHVKAVSIGVIADSR